MRSSRNDRPYLLAGGDEHSSALVTDSEVVMTARFKDDPRVESMIDIQKKLRELSDLIEDFARMVITH